MKSVGRHDRVLLAGLAIALVVVFAGPVRYLLDVAREVERSSGLSLVPALLILTVVFAFIQQSKRQESKAQAAAAAAEATLAEARAVEMERLVTFGQALGRSLDLDAIHEVVVQQLSRLTGTDDAWVLVRVEGKWKALTGTKRDDGPRDPAVHDRMADQAILDPQFLGHEPRVMEGHLCLPLLAGGHAVGVLGVPEASGRLTEGRRRTLTAAATLLGISVRNAQLFREVRDNSLRDGLTGCFNRTHALECIDTELRRARRSQSPVSLLMFDIDHFKEINDRSGHLCGDAVLAAVGIRMYELLRGSDLKCRYGGEEFLVLLPETPLEGAKRVADSLRREISEMRIDWNGAVVRLTASFGVSAAMPSEIDVQALIGRADAALYRAKDQGRNCVRVALETTIERSPAWLASVS